jgi:hypothetical protein
VVALAVGSGSEGDRLVVCVERTGELVAVVAGLATVMGPPTRRHAPEPPSHGLVVVSHRHGTVFVPLEAVTDPGLVLAAIGRAAGIAPGQLVTESSTLPRRRVSRRSWAERRASVRFEPRKEEAVGRLGQ